MVAQYRKLMVVGNPWKNFTQLYEIIRNYCVQCGLCVVMASVENNPCAVGVYTDHAHFHFRQALQLIGYRSLKEAIDQSVWRDMGRVGQTVLLF